MANAVRGPARSNWLGTADGKLVCLRALLRLHEHKTQLRPGPTSLKFLGFVLRRTDRRLQQTGIRRFNLRLRWLRREFREGRIDFPEIQQSLQAWQAHIRDANSEGIRKALWRRVRFARIKTRVSPDLEF